MNAPNMLRVVRRQILEAIAELKNVAVKNREQQEQLKKNSQHS